MCPSVTVYPQRLFQQTHRFKTAQHSAGSYYVHKHVWLILFTIVYYCVYLFKNEQWGRYGPSCLWFSIQVIWTKWLSYYILLQKGLNDSYWAPKALNVVADCLLYSVPFASGITACHAICSHVFTEALLWCWHRSPEVTRVHKKHVEEEGLVDLCEIIYLHGSHLCLHVKTIEGDFHTCQH